MRTALTAPFHCQAGPWRAAVRSAALVACCGAMWLCPVSPLLAQPTEIPSAQETPSPDRGRDLGRLLEDSATGVILPNRPIKADLELTAERSTAWKRENTRRVLLERNVKVGIGAYGFRAERAVVMISPHEGGGGTARHVAVYFDQVTQLGGRGPVTQEADRLLVTVVLSGKVKLSTAAFNREPADQNALVQAAQDRLSRYQAALAKNTAPVPQGRPLFGPEVFNRRQLRREALRPEAQQQEREAAAAGQMQPQPAPQAEQGAEAAPSPQQAPEAEQPQPSAEPQIPELSPDARVDFRADRVVYREQEDEAHVLLMGDLKVMYVDPTSERQVTLSAERGVIFTEPGALSDATSQSTEAGRINGVYLENDVRITDGQYTLQGPRMFYDLAREQAVVLDAVFYTWDIQRQVPLYVRAEKLRQHSRDSWSAEGAKLTTSEFAEPHFAIGVNELTIEAKDQPDGSTDHEMQAKGTTLEALGQPLFYWPSLTGSPTETPLKSVGVGGGSRRGATFETEWDLFNLLNQDQPPGVDASLLVDGYTERGPAVGIEAEYDVANAFGDLETYYLFDKGEDEPGGREEVEPETEHRGRVLWRHRHQLPDDWEATAEIAWLSDPTFLEEFFPEDANASKQYETLLHLKQQREDWAFTFMTRYDLLDFVPQNGPLQTRGNFTGAGQPSVGYTTNKFPELAYYRIGTPLLDERLTWYSENRFSAMQLNLPEDTPARRGFNAAEATAIFGINAQSNPALLNQGFDTALRNAGFDEETRLRGDTRQEIALPMTLGIFDVTPYAVGRVTAYDDGFEDFSGNDDRLRLWGGGGVRASTTFSRSYGQVKSDLLNLHRLRHIIEPHADFLYAATTIDQEELPVYDYDVESISEGTTYSIGIRNTLQTQRGGPGRWRSVDWITLDTRFVDASDDSSRESPIGRFFDYRPEHSLAGQFIYNELEWQVTDTLAFIGNANYSTDTDNLVRWNTGLTLDHTPRLTSFLTYRRIDPLDSSIIRYGFDYLLTKKYHLGYAQSFDLEEGQSRNLTLTVTRRLPRWLLIMTLDFDTIDDSTSFGVALAPEGLSGAGSVMHNPFLDVPTATERGGP